MSTKTGTNDASAHETAALYPRDRCRELRARCMAQARKYRDANRRPVALHWIGHALYWSARASTGLAPDDAQAVAYRRGARYGVRSPAEIADTAARAAAGMNPPGYKPGQPAPVEESASKFPGGAS